MTSSIRKARGIIKSRGGHTEHVNAYDRDNEHVRAHDRGSPGHRLEFLKRDAEYKRTKAQIKHESHIASQERQAKQKRGERHKPMTPSQMAAARKRSSEVARQTNYDALKKAVKEGQDTSPWE